MSADPVSLVFPKSLTTLGDAAFANCTLLSSLQLNEGLLSIGMLAFRFSALESVILPESLLFLRDQAFAHCGLLKKVEVRNPNTDLDFSAFDGTPLIVDGIYGFSGSTAQVAAPIIGAPFHMIFKLSFEEHGGEELDNAFVELGELASLPIPTRAAHIFLGWYMEETYENLIVFPLFVQGSMTFHAKWQELTLTSSVADGKIFTGGRITLTPNVPGGVWDVDGSYLTETEEFTFQGKSAGTTRVTYTVGGASVFYDVTIAASELPQNGQETALPFALMLGGGIAFLAALLLGTRRKKNNA